jgi:hypothetical protein
MKRLKKRTIGKTFRKFITGMFKFFQSNLPLYRREGEKVIMGNKLFFKPKADDWTGIHSGIKPVCRGFLPQETYRAGVVRRVASAVGQGSVTVSFVHEYLKTV